MDQINRDLGRLEGKVEKLDDDVDDMKRMLREMHETITEAKGGWKTLVAVGTIASGVTAFFLKVLGYFKAV